ncbi:MAG: Ppx/GppA family phosphatase [Rhizobiales bacterium]|nr:Ppx/GppA family phosphatase [Hyphomicrobiales bacterium]
MANRSKTRPRAASSAASSARKPRAVQGSAPGRLDHGPPVAVIDIGSNSVRLVVYEGLTRSPTPIFNEKTLCGLGREVQSTGLLARDAVVKAIAALRRYKALCDTLRVQRLWVLATAACREADNGPAFIALAEDICKVPVDVLSGKREAELSALGIISGMYKPDGIAGDLGGGSLELVDIRGTRFSRGVTLPLGGLALQDASSKSIKRAEKIVKTALAQEKSLRAGRGRTFYAVGGTWRALARLHMWQTGYPLHVTHGYAIPAKETFEFSRLVRRVDTGMLARIEVVSDARRPLLSYGALVLEHVVRMVKPQTVMFSALGVREGHLFDCLTVPQQKQDPLLTAAREFNTLRSRSPRHGEELIGWTDYFMTSSGLDETKEEKRLRHAACLIGDIGWRAHPDYRGEQAFNIIAHGAFVGVDHPGRAYLALAVYFRHAGLINDEAAPELVELVSTRMLDRARVLGGAMRVAYMVSAAMPGVLPRTPMRVERGRLVLRIPKGLRSLSGDRVSNRLRQLGRLIGREPVLLVG